GAVDGVALSRQDEAGELRGRRGGHPRNPLLRSARDRCLPDRGGQRILPGLASRRDGGVKNFACNFPPFPFKKSNLAANTTHRAPSPVIERAHYGNNQSLLSAQADLRV